MKNPVIFLVPVICAAVLTACSPPKAAAPPLMKVTVSQPQAATVTNWDEYPGHLEAVEMVEIRPRVSGYIDSIHFTDGAEVKAGDLLFVIDPRPYEADLEHARAQREQAELHLQLTQDDLHRAESLRGTKAISEEEYDSRRNAAREAEAAVAAVKAAETTARINLDYTQIKAPISGKIGRRLVTPGNLVQLQGNGGASTVLATIVSMDPVYCYFDVAEGAFLKYRGNAGGALGTEVCELGLVNEQGFRHLGRLDFFDNQVNPQTGTIRLRAVLDNATRELVPGMFANVRVSDGPAEHALLIPDVAVGSDQGYKYVFVVDPDGKAQTRSIETGRAHGAQRAVLKGLKPDDRVVINGLMMLRPGAKVDAQTADNARQGKEKARAGS